MPGEIVARVRLMVPPSAKCEARRADGYLAVAPDGIVEMISSMLTLFTWITHLYRVISCPSVSLIIWTGGA